MRGLGHAGQLGARDEMSPCPDERHAEGRRSWATSASWGRLAWEGSSTRPNWRSVLGRSSGCSSRCRCLAQHPRIVPVHAVGQFTSVPYFAVQFIGDRSLGD